MHELVRQYAEDQLLLSGDTELTHNHHLIYFLTLAEQAEQFWDTTQEAEWLQNLEANGIICLSGCAGHSIKEIHRFYYA